MITQAITQYPISEFQKLSLWKRGKCKIFSREKVLFAWEWKKKNFLYQKSSHLASLWNRKPCATRKWHIIMITLKTARDGDRRTWQISQHFTWNSLEHFGSNLYYGVNCSVGDPALTKRIESLGTRMRWFRSHEQRVVCLWCFSVGVFRFSVSMTERVWDEREGGWDEASPHCSLRQVRQGGYEEVQSESERRHSIFSKRECDFRILLLNQWLRYY